MKKLLVLMALVAMITCSAFGQVLARGRNNNNFNVYVMRLIVENVKMNSDGNRGYIALALSEDKCQAPLWVNFSNTGSSTSGTSGALYEAVKAGEIKVGMMLILEAPLMQKEMDIFTNTGSVRLTVPSPIRLAARTYNPGEYYWAFDMDIPELLLMISQDYRPL